MGAVKDLLMQVAGPAAGAALGMITAKSNDKRQIEQQRKLTDMQFQANKELMDASYQNQYDLWQKTGYKGQMEQIKAAGLNPALLYGMGGGGGTTTGGGGASVSGASAPSGGGEIMQGTAMGMQMSMMKAQIDVMKTQAEKNKAEADSTRGAAGTIGAAQIADITQGIENKKAQKVLTDLQSANQNLANKIQSESFDDIKDQIKYNTMKTLKEVEILRDQQVITAATKDKMIERAALENVEISTKTFLMKAEASGIASNIKLNEEKINEITASIKNMVIQQGIQVLNIETDRLRIAKEFGGDDEMTKWLDGTLKALGIFLAGKNVAGGLLTPKPNPIGFRK